VDVPDLNGYKGSFMAKADGVKVYIFCYEFGYVMCVTDPESTAVWSMFSITHKALPETFKKPDVLLSEITIDRSLVYIDVLAVN
jgi:hypothetical protein